MTSRDESEIPFVQNAVVAFQWISSLAWCVSAVFSIADASLARLQSGTAKNDAGSSVNYTVEKVDSLELLGTLCTDKTWDAQQEHCDCECSGYVRARACVCM
jgi:hypothetical protein